MSPDDEANAFFCFCLGFTIALAFCCKCCTGSRAVEDELNALKKHAAKMNANAKRTEEQLRAELERERQHAQSALSSERETCAERSSRLLDKDRQWDSYDAVLDPHSLGLEKTEWPIYSTAADWDKPRRSTLVCITGKFNAGKSYVLSKLYNRSFPTGNNMPTMGLSLACQPQPEFDGEDCVLDTAGSMTPIGRDGHEQDEKTVEDLTRDMCLQMADLTILVVGEIDQNDQDTIKALVVDRTFAGLMTVGVDLIVVHNYIQAATEEHLQQEWARFALAAFPDMRAHFRANRTFPILGTSFINSTHSGAGIRVKHVALGNDRSHPAVREHNEVVYRMLRGHIQDAPKKWGEWRFSERVMRIVKGIVTDKYVYAFNVSTVPEWTGRPATPDDEHDGRMPPMCRNSSVCRAAYGSMRLSWVLTWNPPPRARFHRMHRRIDTRSILEPVTLSNSTVQQDLVCGETICTLTMVLPGCRPLRVSALPDRLGAKLQCTVPEHHGVDTTRVPSLLPSFFQHQVDANATKMPWGLSTRFRRYTYEAGVLRLYFAPRDAPYGWRDCLHLGVELLDMPGGPVVAASVVLALVAALLAFLAWFLDRCRAAQGASPGAPAAAAVAPGSTPWAPVAAAVAPGGTDRAKRVATPEAQKEHTTPGHESPVVPLSHDAAGARQDVDGSAGVAMPSEAQQEPTVLRDGVGIAASPPEPAGGGADVGGGSAAEAE